MVGGTWKTNNAWGLIIIVDLSCCLWLLQCMLIAAIMHCSFYWTQLCLESDLWVRMSVRQWVKDVLELKRWRYQLNTNWRCQLGNLRQCIQGSLSFVLFPDTFCFTSDGNTLCKILKNLSQNYDTSYMIHHISCIIYAKYKSLLRSKKSFSQKAAASNWASTLSQQHINLNNTNTNLNNI